MTEPKLRFKREDGTDFPEWESDELKSIFPKIRNGFVGTVSESFADKAAGIRYIEGTNIHNGVISDDVEIYVTKAFHDSHPNSKLKADDIVMVQSGHIGDCAVVGEKYEGSNCHALIIMSNGGQCDSRFYSYYFHCGSGYNKMKMYMQGNTVKHILASDMQTFIVPIPDIEEQQKIADFLSTVDDIISQSEAEVRNLEQQKKAAMQKIFSQEVRFKREDGTEFPEWEEKRFGTTVMIERGGSPRPIKQYITNDEGYNWVKIGDAPEYGRYITHTAEKIKKSGLSKTRQVFKGDLILSNSMSFGKPYIMAIDGCIHDGWLLIRNNQNIYNLVYLCYLLGTEYMFKQYKSFASGSTVNNLNKDLVSMTTAFIPCLEEQQKIANFLSAYDEAITYAKQELDKWKELKKGLLQQMFV